LQMNDGIEELTEACVKKWGVPAQIVMTMEEMAELAKELSKFYRGKGDSLKIAEEIADVRLMLDQMEHIFDFKDTVTEAREFKIARLKERLKQ